MPDLHIGAALLFLIPGLLAYCAFYGIFSGGKKVSVAPPAANSIEALTIILLASLFAHAIIIGIALLDATACRTGYCLGLPDLSALMLASTRGGAFGAGQARTILFGALLEGAATYLGILLWLKWLTRADRLPGWLYGWTADLANLLDNSDRLVIAYVLTRHDIGDRTVVYAGAVLDMAVARDGTITRVTLEDCERYLVAMNKPLASGPPLSEFALITIERENIRNVSFEPFILADPAAPPAIAA